MANSTTTSHSGCPCDRLIIPLKPDIPAGLSLLPRQLGGFPEFRTALLSHISSHQLLDVDIVPVHQQHPLQHWLAREGEDLGIMLLEMWAYVLDILSFYEERIANESYLQTARRDTALRRLVELIGYTPRPATAASAILALLADKGKGLVSVPVGTAFRSSGFDGEPPQVFEVAAGTSIDPALNRWTLAPIREGVFEEITTPAGGANVSESDLVLLTWERHEAIAAVVSLFESPGSPVALLDSDQYGDADVSGKTVTLPSGKPILYGKAASVIGVTAFDALDGATYHRIKTQPTITPFSGTQLTGIRFQRTVLEAGVQTANTTDDSVQITLESQQTDISVNDIVLLARDAKPIPFRVVEVNHLATIKFGEEPVSEDGVQPFTLTTGLRLYPKPPSAWTSEPSRLRLHFNLVDAGKLTRPAEDRLELANLQSGAAFDGKAEPPEKEASGTVLLAGANGNGAKLKANVDITADGVGQLQPQQGAESFDAALRTPVKVYGNLVEVTRGETVTNEVFGSGDPSQAFQSFTLKKSPLTWFDDPSGVNGLRSTLTVRVNGILWTEVASFYGTGPQDEVFIIREDNKGKSVVMFGDGKTGARLPSGVGNITATYRHGAGAAKPPANSITQIARAVKGLRRVVNPVAAGGGSDADNPDNLRTNASTSSLLLGRAVSLADFEALAREFGGVVNAQANWTWDGRMQRAVVKIWFISDGGSIAKSLRSHLLGQSDPNVPLEATEAQALKKPLVVDLAVDEKYNSDDVEQAVVAALTNQETGLLTLKNIPIGAPLFRSRVLAQIHGVAGVVSVRALRFDGAEAGAAILAEEGQYLDFTNQLTVGNTTSGDILI